MSFRLSANFSRQPNPFFMLKQKAINLMNTIITSEKLHLSSIRKKLPFTVNHGLSAFRIKDVLNLVHKLDFDVYLPTLNKKLQRDFVWSLLQKQELILSLLKGIKIPTMAFVHVNHETFQVIDGKQRLSAWISFVNGEFPIIHNEIEFYFNDLDDSCQMELTHSYIVADVAYEYTGEYQMLIPDEYKIQWFELINFAGTLQDKAHLEYLKQ